MTPHPRRPAVRRMGHRAGAFLLVFAGLLSGGRTQPAAAQTMRTTTVSRQYHGEKQLSARIEFGAGTLALRPAAPGTLYGMRLYYDTERFQPVSRYEAATGDLLLGVSSTGGGGIRVSSRKQLHQEAVIELSPEVELSLDVELGAVEAGLDLGGLRLLEAHVKTAASKTILRFSRQNPGDCRTLELNAGAAEFSAYGLGNSRCRSIRFEGGVGDVTLDLTGAWDADARVVAKLTLGGLTLRLPRDLGVELDMDRFLATFSSTGFEKRGSTYVSEGYDGKARHLSISVTSNVGDVKVVWVDN